MKQSRNKILLLCLALLPFLLPAQAPFQQLSAYNTSFTLKTGTFNDVQCLNATGLAGAEVVAIGTNSSPTAEGLFGVFDQNGNVIYYKEYVNGNPVQAEAIAELPNTDIVLAFYDPVDEASDIVVMNINGTLDWQIRLPDFHVRAAHAGPAPYFGGEGIFLTGNKTGPGGHVAIYAFDKFGTQQFAQTHTITGHDSSVGNAIHYDDNMNHVVVVGTADKTGAQVTSMFSIRIPSSGFWFFGAVYTDNANIENYSAKALVPNPTLNSNFAVAYERSIDGAPFDQIGIMNIDLFLTPTWSNLYDGVNFFSGKNYRVTGIEAVGNSFIACGTFNSKAHPLQSSAYALAVDMQGGSPKMNEYETASYYPSEGCGIEGISLNPTNGLPYMAGYFQTLPGGANWPSGNDPRSFWLLSTSPYAEGLCWTSGETQPMPSNASYIGLFFPWGSMPAATASPLTSAFQDQVETPQCSFSKLAGGSELENEAQVQAYFLERQERIVVEIPSDVKGEGQIELLDLQGRLLVTLSAKAGKQAIDTRGLSKGIYLVRTEMAGLPMTVKKLMVK